MMPAYDNMVEALADLKKRGYTTDFNLSFDKVKCTETGACLTPSQFEIVAHYRFEGDTDPSNSSVLYVIEAIDGSMKGILVSAYGIYSDPVSDSMINKLKAEK